jgi:hypothetical protein
MIRQGLVRKEDINLYTLLLPILVLSVSSEKNNRGRKEEPLTGFVDLPAECLRPCWTTIHDHPTMATQVAS